MRIRNYSPEDYEAIKALYLQGDLYGGQFDEARDSKEKLAAVTQADPQSILVCEENGEILGTISLIENTRVAWIFRFAVAKTEHEKSAAKSLHTAACGILSARGHSQMLVYTPDNDPRLDQRYLDLGMKKGNAYTCFWQKLAADL